MLGLKARLSRPLKRRIGNAAHDPVPVSSREKRGQGLRQQTPRTARATLAMCLQPGPRALTTPLCAAHPTCVLGSVPPFLSWPCPLAHCQLPRGPHPGPTFLLLGSPWTRRPLTPTQSADTAARSAPPEGG